MTTCPSEDELVRLVEGALAEASLAAIEDHVDGCEHCGAVIASLGALGKVEAPRRIGRYQLDRRIAAGGMGEVWAAWDPELRREIAVKLVRPDRADDTKERERLLREARALARLTHPNVLAVHDVGEQDGEVFLATELVAGDTLATRGSASADWRMLVRLYVQAARGLAAAHAAGLVHRDVKPANLLLGVDGRVRVADFGLAVRSRTPSPNAPTETLSQDASPSITASGLVAGTPAYMAPEQRAGRPADAPADQFALCVALGEAIAGRRPPPDLDVPAMIAFVVERRNHDPGLDEVCGVIVRGLEKDPDARFPDMAALADALEAIVGDLHAGASAGAGTIAAPPPVDGNELARNVTRTRGGLAAGTVVIAAIVGAAGVGAIWFVGTRDRERPPDLVANQRTDQIAPAVPDAAVTPSLPVASQRTDQIAPTVPDAAVAPAPPIASQRTDQIAPAVPDASAPANRPPKQVLAPSQPSAGYPTSNPGAPRAVPPSPARIQAYVDAAGLVNRRDPACRSAFARFDTFGVALPSVPPREDALLRARCELLAGHCDVGARAIAAQLGNEGLSGPEIAEQVKREVDTNCPTSIGTWQERLTRLEAQAPQLQFGTVAQLERALDSAAAIDHDAAGAMTRSHRITLTNALGHLAQGFARLAGHCAEARRARQLGDYDPMEMTDALKQCLSGTTP